MKPLQALAATLLTFGATLPAVGAISNPLSEDIVGAGGRVTITETPSLIFGGTDYSVRVVGDSQISWFAISNAGGDVGATTFAPFFNWGAIVTNPSAWDEGLLVEGIEGITVSFNTNTLGSYASFFGADPGVTIFYLAYGATDSEFETNEITANNSPTGFVFHFGALLASEFVAGTGNGTIVDQSLSAAVPEPASLTLWGLGALGCAMAGYRRRKAA